MITPWVTLLLLVTFLLLLAFWWKSRLVAFDKVSEQRESSLWAKLSEASATEREQRVAGFRAERRRERLWVKAAMVASFAGLFVLLFFAYTVVPGWDEDRYDDARAAGEIEYASGWESGCRYVMDFGSEGASSTLFFGDQQYDVTFCNGLNQATKVRDFWYYAQPPRDMLDGVDEYPNIAFNLGFYGAIATLFAAQPTLCFEDRCVTYEDVDYALFDEASRMWDLNQGWP